MTRLTADPAVRYWELLAELSRPGVDYRATFALPVYAHERHERQSRPWPAAEPRGRGTGLVLALALAVVLAAPWLAWPRAMGALWDRAPRLAAAGWLMVRHPAPETGSGSPVALAPAGDGSALGLTGYALLRFPAGDLDDFGRVFDNRAYHERFGRYPKAWSALHRSGERLWIGGWYGEVLARDGGGWTRLGGDGDPIDARVNALLDEGDALYAATRKGLWRRDRAGWEREAAFGTRSVVALARGERGRTWALAADGLYRRDDGRWRRLWRPGPDDGWPTSLRAAGDGWLIGTSRSLVRVDGADEPETLVAGHPVAGADARGDLVLAAAGREGLWLVEPGRPTPVRLELPGAWNLRGVAIDGTKVWLVDLDGGLRRWPLAALLGLAPRRGER